MATTRSSNASRVLVLSLAALSSCHHQRSSAREGGGGPDAAVRNKGDRRPDGGQKDAFAAPAKFVPSPQKFESALGLVCDEDRRILIWGAHWLYLGAQEKGTVRWLREARMNEAYLQKAFLAPEGLVALQKLRVVEDDEGTVDYGELVFQNDSGAEVGAWRPPFGFADVYFHGSSAWVNTSDTLVSVGRTGEPREAFSLRPRELELPVATKDAQVVCRKRLGRPVHLGEEEPAAAGCRSSLGWAFEGNWGYFSPLSCAGHLIEFEDRAAQPRGQQRWQSLTLRNIQTGKARSTWKGSGRQLACWQDKVLVEIETGRLWQLPSLQSSGVARCASQPAALWGQGPDCGWCITKSGTLERAELLRQ